MGLCHAILHCVSVCKLLDEFFALQAAKTGNTKEKENFILLNLEATPTSNKLEGGKQHFSKYL
jgi:hypothetical protein